MIQRTTVKMQSLPMSRLSVNRSTSFLGGGIGVVRDRRNSIMREPWSMRNNIPCRALQYKYFDASLICKNNSEFSKKFQQAYASIVFLELEKAVQMRNFSRAFLLIIELKHIGCEKLINAPDAFGRRALMRLASQDENKPQSLKILKLLLDKSEVDPNMQDCQGNTALHEAAARQNARMMMLLRAHPKTNLEIKNSKGNTSTDVFYNRYLERIEEGRANGYWE